LDKDLPEERFKNSHLRLLGNSQEGAATPQNFDLSSWIRPDVFSDRNRVAEFQDSRRCRLQRCEDG